MYFVDLCKNLTVLICGGVDALLNLSGLISQANEIEDVYT